MNIARRSLISHPRRLLPLALSMLVVAPWISAAPAEVAALKEPTARPEEIKWMAFPDPQFTVSGLPWFEENHHALSRLPAEYKDQYPRGIWGLGQDPTGGRIRFRTDATLVAIRLEYPHASTMRNMSPIGASGVDLYVESVYWGNTSGDTQAGPGHVYQYVYYNLPGVPRMMRDVTLYLPLYSGVKVLAIGLNLAARVGPPAPFAAGKPVVFYGTSITQGGCVSRPGMAFEAIVGRRLNVDFINLGFSGAGKYEEIMSKVVAEIDAACFVLDGSNLAEASENAKVYGPFVDALRARHPITPIVVVSPLYSAQELTMPSRKRQLLERREFTRKFVSDRIAAGDNAISLVEGLDLLGPARGAGLVDGSHLNDLGSQWVADGFTARLAPILNLPFESP